MIGVNEEYSYKGFCDFVNEQPDDKVINNLSWAASSLGDYAESLPSYCREDAQYMSYGIFKAAPHVRECLDGDNISTYSELKSLINQPA